MKRPPCLSGFVKKSNPSGRCRHEVRAHHFLISIVVLTKRSAIADITAGRASAIRSAASSPTSSPAVRYWNRARQRYHRLSARYSRARVSLPTQAGRLGPDNRGKPRLLDLERRIPARDRFAPDSLLEGSEFEISVPRYPRWSRASPRSAIRAEHRLSPKSSSLWTCRWRELGSSDPRFTLQRERR